MGTAGRIAEIFAATWTKWSGWRSRWITAIVTLHVSAIARAARAEEDDAKWAMWWPGN